MAEQREIFSALQVRRGKERHTVELFKSTEWPELPGAEPNLYRVRLDRKWIQTHGRYTWMTPTAVAGLVVELLAGHPVSGLCEAPALARGVAVTVDMADGSGLTECVRTASVPILGWDGRWWVFVMGRKSPVAVDEIWTVHNV